MQVKTKNVLVGGLVVLLVGMLWYRVVYSPMTSKASKAKTAAHDADTQSANLQQALKGTSSSAKKKGESASNDAMLAAVPADTNEASFLRSLDALRLSSGADWQTVTPSVPTPSGTYQTISVAITAQGTEDQIARYVAGLAALPRAFVADNVSLSQAGSTAPAGSVGAHGAVFLGDLQQVTISGRIFTSAAATPATGTGGAATTPVTGAPAPTGGSTTGTVNG